MNEESRWPAAIGSLRTIQRTNSYNDDVNPAPSGDRDSALSDSCECETYGYCWSCAVATGKTQDSELEILLDQVLLLLRRYVVFKSEAEPCALTLWILHTHSFEAADTTPYLHITSPEKRSGKTRLLELLELLVARPWRLVSPTEAVVYRKVQADKPTLLLDEVDTLFSSSFSDSLRGLLNAGHRRGASVSRCVGKNFDVQEFDAFCPKALAGIGRLPDTISDRSIPILMERRTKSESVSRFRYVEVRDRCSPIAERLQSWASAGSAQLQLARPQMPDALDDRAADAWEALIAIADLASRKWGDLARRSATRLSVPGKEGSIETGNLLAAIRDVFDELGSASVPSQTILNKLIAVEQDQWASFWSKDLASGNLRGPASALAGFLRPYGVRPRKIRDGSRTVNGYRREDFEEAWSRYVADRRNGTSEQASSSGVSVLLDADG